MTWRLLAGKPIKARWNGGAEDQPALRRGILPVQIGRFGGGIVGHAGSVTPPDCSRKGLSNECRGNQKQEIAISLHSRMRLAQPLHHEFPRRVRQQTNTMRQKQTRCSPLLPSATFPF